MKKILSLSTFLICFINLAQSSFGDVVGTVLDLETKKPLPLAHAWIYDIDKTYEAFADKDGRFRITGIPAGQYTLHLSFKKDSMHVMVDVPIDGYASLGSVFLGALSHTTKEVVIKEKLKLKYGELPRPEFNNNDLKHAPNKFSISTLATQLSSEIKMAEDGALIFKGARKGDMIYILDGIKLNQVYNVPSCSIHKMTVYTGGLPAKYGDTLGGAIVVETYGYFDLLRQRN
jgi:hypothetical protein